MANPPPKLFSPRLFATSPSSSPPVEGREKPGDFPSSSKVASPSPFLLLPLPLPLPLFEGSGQVSPDSSHGRRKEEEEEEEEEEAVVAESGSEEREESEERGAVVFFFGSGEADYWSSGASSSCECVCVCPGKGERRRRSVRHGGKRKGGPRASS